MVLTRGTKDGHVCGGYDSASSEMLFQSSRVMIVSAIMPEPIEMVCLKRLRVCEKRVQIVENVEEGAGRWASMSTSNVWVGGWVGALMG